MKTFNATQGKTAASGAASGGAARPPSGGPYEAAEGEMINPELDEHEAAGFDYDHNGSTEAF
jgi:hypothetical protein